MKAKEMHVEHVTIWAKDVLDAIEDDFERNEPVELYCCAISKGRMPGFERVAIGDVIYLKGSGGPYRWRGVVTHNRVRGKKLPPLLAEYDNLDELKKLLCRHWWAGGPAKEYSYWKQTEERKRRGAVIAFTLRNIKRWNYQPPENRQRQMWYVLDTPTKRRKWSTWL
jgi:hypothetical protein